MQPASSASKRFSYICSWIRHHLPLYVGGDEEDKAARIRYLKRSKENAEKFVESVILGDHYASIEDLKEALDYKAFIRADPYMRRTGAEMEKQIFDNKDPDW